jgi:hypothetical protein
MRIFLLLNRDLPRVEFSEPIICRTTSSIYLLKPENEKLFQILSEFQNFVCCSKKNPTIRCTKMFFNFFCMSNYNFDSCSKNFVF